MTRRPTIDQILGELERLERKDLALMQRGGSRFSMNHSMRLWADGAKHALAWAVGRRDDPKHRFAADRPPTVALDLLETALRPRRLRRRGVKMP